MRLIDIKRYINIAKENFKPTLTTSNGYYFIGNVIQTQKAINALYDSGIIEHSDLRIDIYTEILSSKMNSWKVDANQYSTYKKELDKVQLIIDTFSLWLDHYVPIEEKETNINIKLPQINTLSDFTTSAGCIKKAFSQVVSEFGGDIKVKQFDYGSSWIILEADSIGTVKFIGAIVSSAYIIAKWVLSLLKTIEEIKSLRLDNKLKALEIEEKEFVKARALQESKKINKDFFKNDDDSSTINEREDRISVSIMEFVRILKAGGEIHPSLTSSKTIEDIYPKYSTSISFTPIPLISQPIPDDIEDNKEQSNPNTNRTDQEEK